MVKRYGGNDFVQRYVFKWARNEPNEGAHRQFSGIVEPNRKSYYIGQMRKGFVLFMVITWNTKHTTSRFYWCTTGKKFFASKYLKYSQFMLQSLVMTFLLIRISLVQIWMAFELTTSRS